ncbi:hypothetical protein FHW94_001589 [Novosphingobium sp. SG720]|nr:hypothetical protein [Novosphingobium sp. SG720]
MPTLPPLPALPAAAATFVAKPKPRLPATARSLRRREGQGASIAVWVNEGGAGEDAT